MSSLKTQKCFDKSLTTKAKPQKPNHLWTFGGITMCNARDKSEARREEHLAGPLGKNSFRCLIWSHFMTIHQVTLDSRFHCPKTACVLTPRQYGPLTSLITLHDHTPGDVKQSMSLFHVYSHPDNMALWCHWTHFMTMHKVISNNQQRFSRPVGFVCGSCVDAE